MISYLTKCWRQSIPKASHNLISKPKANPSKEKTHLLDSPFP